MAKKSAVAGPIMAEPQEPVVAAPRQKRPGWVLFQSRGRCYVEGAFVEDAGMTLKLSPAAAFRQRKNKNLELHEGNTGVIPELPQDAPKDKKSPEYKAYEAEFMTDLEDGDPILGAAPVAIRLIKQ